MTGKIVLTSRDFDSIPPFKEYEKPLTGNEKYILKAVKKNGIITRPWATRLLKIPRNTANNAFNNLKNMGFLTSDYIILRGEDGQKRKTRVYYPTKKLKNHKL